MEKNFRLWTFQATGAIKELKTKGILQSGWETYKQTGAFFKSYRWMAEQLTARRIYCMNSAPIWAWHSCRKFENGPTLLDARCLLSDIQIEGGIQTIEFECPRKLALLSDYGVWNMVVDDFFYSEEERSIDKKIEDRLFKISRKNFVKDDCIQAALPFLKLDWVKEIRELNLKPGDYSFNDNEKV